MAFAHMDSLIKSENDKHEAVGKAHPTDTTIRVCRGLSLAGGHGGVL